MRRALALLPALALTACSGYSTAPVTSGTERAQAALAAELSTRVAGAPLSCIPSHATTEMDAVGRDIVFRNGSDIYINRTDGGCENAQMAGHTFVIDNRGGAGNLCHNTIVRVVSSSNGMYAGSCALGDFVPYRFRR